MQEGAQAEQADSDITPEERADLIKKAEKFIPEEEKRRAVEEAKAQTAIEDAIIARHQATTGRKFPTREQNLLDAGEWNARTETAKREKVETAIQNAMEYGDKKRAEEKVKISKPTTTQLSQPNLGQRVVSAIKGVIRK